MDIMNIKTSRNMLIITQMSSLVFVHMYITTCAHSHKAHCSYKGLNVPRKVQI